MESFGISFKRNSGGDGRVKSGGLISSCCPCNLHGKAEIEEKSRVQAKTSKILTKN